MADQSNRRIDKLTRGSSPVFGRKSILNVLKFLKQGTEIYLRLVKCSSEVTTEEGKVSTEEQKSISSSRHRASSQFR